MEQLSLFNPPYVYLIDASSIFSQKITDKCPRQVHKSLWEKIDEYIENEVIVTCSEIKEEIEKDDEIKDWIIAKQCMILPIDDEIQQNVSKIVNEHPKMISFNGDCGSSSGDAFLIATAMKYKLAIITEENKEKNNKIPDICRCYNIPTYSITDLCIKEGWTF